MAKKRVTRRAKKSGKRRIDRAQGRIRAGGVANLEARVRYRRLPARPGLKGRFVDISKLSRGQFSRLKLKPELWVKARTLVGPAGEVTRVDRPRLRPTRAEWGYRRRKKPIGRDTVRRKVRDVFGAQLKKKGRGDALEFDTNTPRRRRAVKKKARRVLRRR